MKSCFSNLWLERFFAAIGGSFRSGGKIGGKTFFFDFLLTEMPLFFPLCGFCRNPASGVPSAKLRRAAARANHEVCSFLPPRHHEKDTRMSVGLCVFNFVDFVETPRAGSPRQSFAAPRLARTTRFAPFYRLATTKKTPIRVSFSWWTEVDSDHRSQRRQIYSLLPLATRESVHNQIVGAGDWNRTRNLLITNQLLCQLSYTSTPFLMVPWGGIEPPTDGFSVRCSTD